MLTLAGYAVRESADGFRALHALDEKPMPDCIVLDLMLPVLSKGLEVLERQDLTPEASQRMADLLRARLKRLS